MHKDLSFRWIILLGLVFAGLGGLLWRADRPTAPSLGKGDRLIGFTPEDAVWLELSPVGGEPLRCEKTADGWALAKPEAARADAQAMAEILGTLSGARIVEVIARAPEDLAGFGFDAPPAGGARIGLKDGGQLSIALGGDVPLNRMYVYGRGSVSPDVFMLFSGVRRVIRRTPFDLRDKPVLSFDPARLKRIEIDSDGRRITLQRRTGTWHITEPQEALADQAKVAEPHRGSARNPRAGVRSQPDRLGPLGLGELLDRVGERQ